MTLGELDAWFEKHTFLTMLVGNLLMMLLTGLINHALRLQTVEEWERFKIAHPRAAAFRLFLRGWGFNELQFLEGVRGLIQGRLSPKKER